jgi:glyoxylate carboligase
MTSSSIGQPSPPTPNDYWRRKRLSYVYPVWNEGFPAISGVFGALNRAPDKITFVQARHEEMAAFMASAYAKFSGELGVCIATSGPGASHLITGLYDARLDHMPVLAIVGQQSRDALGGHYQQEVDLVSLFKDVAGAFVQQASAPAQVRHLIDRAIRIALGDRRITVIVLQAICRKRRTATRLANMGRCVPAWASQSRA